MRQNILPYFIVLFLIYGCATTPVVLQPIQSKKYKDINKYTYVYINQTQPITSSSSVGIPGMAPYTGGYYHSVKKTINPSDIISGILMKKGLVIVDNISGNSSALITSYGQSGRRDTSSGYTLEVSIQILDAKTKELVYTCTAEGQGKTEADDISIAINRCLSEL